MNARSSHRRNRPPTRDARQHRRPLWLEKALLLRRARSARSAALWPGTGQVKAEELGNSTRHRRIPPPNSHSRPIVVETLLYH